MLARSKFFDQAVRDGGRVVARCDVLAQGVTVCAGVPVSAGQVRADRSGFARRSGTVTVADPTLVPTLATDLLAPYGSELRLWRGVVLPDGTEEALCIGTLVVWEAETGFPFDGVKVTGYDRMKLVEQARFLYPRTLGEGSVIARLQTLLMEAVPWAGSLNVRPGITDAYAGPVTYDESRKDAVADMAAALGGEVFCDPFGTFQLAPIPDPAGPVSWLLNTGTGGALVGLRRKLSRDGVYNAVVARGTGTTLAAPPVSIPAYDDDPYSPTYALGVSLLTGRAFSLSPTFLASPLIADVDQANKAARSRLRDITGLQRSVQVQGIMQPALEPGDIIGIFDGTTTEQHLAEGFAIDMSPAGGSMQIDTRTTSYRLAA
jgi:hypothetical protein